MVVVLQKAGDLEKVYELVSDNQFLALELSNYLHLVFQCFKKVELNLTKKYDQQNLKGINYP